VGGVVVHKLRFRFSICGSVPEIFAIKVESCQKSRKILDGFLAILNFCGRALQKLYPVYHSCLAARRLNKFHEDAPTNPEVIEPNTVNFRPNFKFSRLNFWGDPRPPCECALASLGQSLAHVKIWGGAAPPKGRNVVSRKKVDYGLYTLGSITFSFMDQSTPTFLTQRGRGGSW